MKQFLQKIKNVLSFNWKSCLRLMIIVIISTFLGWLFKDIAFGKFFSDANEKTYMSYYYNNYSSKYEDENKGDKWASKLFKCDGKYEAEMEDVVLIHLGDTWKYRIPEVLTEIMKYNPTVIGLDIIYYDTTKNDSMNNRIREICGDKLILAAEEKNNVITTSSFYAVDSSIAVLGSVKTQSIGSFDKYEIINGQSLYTFPYLLSKKHCDYHNIDLSCDDIVINYRQYSLLPVNLENASEEDMKYNIRMAGISEKVVILGIIDINIDKVIIPCDLPAWSPYDLDMQKKDVLGSAMAGIFNHAYVVRSLIHPSISFKMRLNGLANIVIISFYVLLFLFFQRIEGREKKNTRKVVIRLIGQLFFVFFVIITCRPPFFLTNHFNFVFDFSLALFSIVFVRIVDTLYCLASSFSHKYIK